MNDKVSKYNCEAEHSDCILLYNTLTDKLLPISYNDYAIIETLMEHLHVFQEKYPDLYLDFKKSGFIIPSDYDELAYIKLQNKRRIFTNKDYHITINPTLDCNLKCWYCSVDYAGTHHNKERMSDEIVNSLNKHIEDLVIRQKANSILVDWFGGEPLMYFDDVICKVSEFAKKIASEHNVSFRQQITTNGTLLNEERIRQMKDSNFTFFQISTDGNEKRNNQIKHYADRRGTYRDVVDNINLLAEIIPNIQIALRINYDKQTLKNIKDIVSDFSENSKKCIIVDFQRVWQIPNDDKLQQLLQTAKDDFKIAGFTPRLGSYRTLTFKSCYADSYNHYVINYNGKVFKCTARDYGDDLVIGNLQSSGEIIWNDGLLSKMFEKATFENERCEKCMMLPLCMGPCIQKNYDYRKNKNSTALPCLYENTESHLTSYVLGIAKQRNFIK